jgi:single-strand DNA-binding protein
MNSLNKVQLIGNLTADPEIKQTPNGQFVANFSIATNRTWKDTS